MHRSTLCLLAMLAAPAWAADAPAADRIPADAIGRPYYDCLLDQARSRRGSLDTAIAAARKACEPKSNDLFTSIVLLRMENGVYDSEAQRQAARDEHAKAIVDITALARETLAAAGRK